MRRPARWWLALAVVCAAPAARAVPGEVGLAAKGPAERVAVELPVREVTVFSDRARVVRKGEVKVESGLGTVHLPLLPATIDPSSVRVEASGGARLVRVEVQKATLDEFPRNEAEKLLREIEALRDEAQALQDSLVSWDEERRLLETVRPTSQPGPDAKGNVWLLEPAGWTNSLRFLSAREEKAAGALDPLEEKLAEKKRALTELCEKARQLAVGSNGQPGYKVDAIVDGKGRAATLALTYVAQNARWFPSYDVRYQPGDANVDVELSARVSQETGEDWTDAKLTLSTAVPATTAQLPQLAVWKIGEKQRFIPTPQALPQSPLPPAPRRAPEPVLEEERAHDQQLRQQLAALANDVLGGNVVARPPPPPPRAPAPAYSPPASKATLGNDESYEFDSEAVEGEMEPAPAEAPKMDAPAPSRPSAMPMPSVEVSSRSSSGSIFGGRSKPTESVSFGAPRGWQAPYFQADLPAALAGGYDFTYAAARPETVHTGGEARRVALFSQRFPAEALLRIYPALSPQAYLVAEVRNTSDRPLLKGQAHLFVGADMVGDATLPTTAAGEKVTLPLGVDDAIRVERNVQVVSSQKGFISKQDVSGYQVVIELLNPRQRTVTAEVVDQVPLSRLSEVEITLDKVEPALSPKEHDQTEGLLTWKLELPQGQKKTVSFVYSVARPKGARLWQTSTPQGSR